MDARHRLVGPHRRSARHDQGRARRRHQLLRHRAGLRRRRRGRDDPRATTSRNATTSCSRRRSATTSRPSASSRASRERPHDWRPGIGPPPGRRVVARGSAPTTSTCCSCTTRASSRSSTTRCGRRSSRCATRARSASSASRSGPRSVGSRKATARSTTGRSRRCRPSSTCSEQEPGPHVRARATASQTARSRLIARVPHASDTLSGKITLDTVFPPGDHRAHRNRDNMLDNFEKAETLGFLWTPETGRTIGQAAIAGHPRQPRVRVRAADRALGRRGARVRRARRSSRSPTTRRATLDELCARNFDHVDRYVMPLKSSV